MAFQSREEILGRDTVACWLRHETIRGKYDTDRRTSLVKENWEVSVRVLEQAECYANFWDSIIGTTYMYGLSRQTFGQVRRSTCVSADTTCSTSGGKQDDGITKELDVVLEDGLLLCSELGL